MLTALKVQGSFRGISARPLHPEFVKALLGMPQQLLVEPGIANVNYTMFEADRKQPAAVEKQAVNEHAEPEGERPPHGEDDDESDLDLSFGA